MIDKKTQLKVGVTTVVAVGIIVIGIIWGKEYRFTQDFTVLRIRFENVNGLDKGDPVLWAGLRCGEVIDVKLDPSGAKGAIVVVRMALKQPILYSDYVIRAEDFSLMGDKMVTIDQGREGQAVDLRETLTGTGTAGMQGLSKQATEVLEQINTFLFNLNSSIDLGELNRSMKVSIEDLGVAAVNLRELLTKNRAAIENAVKNFEDSSEEFKKIISGNDETITRILTRADTLTSRLNNVLARWDSSTVFLDTLRTYVENQDGTIRKLFFSDSLYNEIRTIGQNLDSLITQAREGELHFNIDWW